MRTTKTLTEQEITTHALKGKEQGFTLAEIADSLKTYRTSSGKPITRKTVSNALFRSKPKTPTSEAIAPSLHSAAKTIKHKRRTPDKSPGAPHLERQAKMALGAAYWESFLYVMSGIYLEFTKRVKDFETPASTS